MNLSTVARVKALVSSFGTAPANADTEIAAVLATVSGAVERYLDRTVLAASVTEYFDVEYGMECVRLRAYPVTALTSVHYDADQSFGAETALTSDDYYLPTLDPSGLLAFVSPFSPSRTHRRALKVVYTGGMAATADAFAAAFPDIAGAVDVQCSHEWQRRNALGVTNISYPDGTNASLSFDRWIPSVKQVLDTYRRLS